MSIFATYVSSADLARDKKDEFDRRTQGLPPLKIPTPTIPRAATPTYKPPTFSGMANGPLPTMSYEDIGARSEGTDGRSSPRGLLRSSRGGDVEAFRKFADSLPPLSVKAPTKEEAAGMGRHGAAKKAEDDAKRFNAWVAEQDKVRRARLSEQPQMPSLPIEAEKRHEYSASSTPLHISQMSPERQEELSQGLAAEAAKAMEWPGVAGGMELLDKYGRQVVNPQAEIISGPELRGEYGIPPSMHLGGKQGVESGIGRFVREAKEKGQEQAWSEAGKRWEESPEKYPLQKFAAEIIVPTEAVLNVLPDPAIEGLPALARLAGKGIGKGIKAAENVPAGMPQMARELATGEAGFARIPEGKAQEVVGATTKAIGADPNVSYDMKYKVVDLGELVPSHTDLLGPNQNYPVELQPRLRDRAASEMQIDKIARDLNPDALLDDVHQIDRGPMIVGSDNVVESGNGRVLALRRALTRYPEQYKAYKKALLSKAQEYGIDPASLQGIQTPVLVRERTTPVNRAQFAREANEAAVLTMSPFEQAIQDGRRVSNEMAASLEIGETQSVEQALQSGANRPIVQQFVGTLSPNERAALLDAQGNLNQIGLLRLKAALFARTYPGDAGKRLAEAFFESLDPTVKRIEQGMFGSLGAIARAEGMIRTGQRASTLTIAEDLSKAVDVLARLRQQGTKVADYTAQSSMFQRELNPFQERLLQYLSEMGNSPKKVREFIRAYAEAVEAAPPPEQMGLFGEVKQPKKEEILDRAIKRQREAEDVAAPLFAGLDRPEAEVPAGGEPLAQAQAAPAPQEGARLEGGEVRLEPPAPAAAKAAGDVTAKGKEPWEMTKREAARQRALSVNAYEVTGKGKELWEITRDEAAGQPVSGYVQAKKSLKDGGKYELWYTGTRNKIEITDGQLYDSPRQAKLDYQLRTHKAAVEQAISEGRPVPPSVLADYPDLARKAETPAVEAPKPVEAVVPPSSEPLKPPEPPTAQGAMPEPEPEPLKAGAAVADQPRLIDAPVAVAEPPSGPPGGTPAGPSEYREKPGFAGNIRLSKYPEEVQPLIKAWADANPTEWQEARRGVRSDTQVMEDAQKLVDQTGGDAKRFSARWKMGQAWNAEEILALRGALRSKAQELGSVQKLVRAGGDSSENLLKLRVLLQEHAALQEAVHGVTAEAGRALRQFRQTAMDAIASGDTAKIEKVLSKLGGREDAEKLSALLGKLDLDDPDQMYAFIRQVLKPKAQDYLTEIFYNSILSGPKTHIVNFLSNATTALMYPLELGSAAAAETLLAALERRPRARYFGEVPAALHGLYTSIPEGVTAAAYLFKHGFSMESAAKAEFRPHAFTGKLGYVINIPGTTLEAADQMFHAINARATIQAMAYRMGKADPEKMAELLRNPPEKLLEMADKEAEYRLFRQEPDAIARSIMHIRGLEVPVLGITPLRFVIPFVRVPVNIVKYGLERSPLGFLNPVLWRNIAKRSPEAADQIGKAAIGAFVAAGVAWYVADGKITGAAPTDRTERDRFYRLGMQPYSIKVGDRWVSYQRIEPFNQTLSQVASVVNALSSKDKTVDQQIGQVVADIGKNAISQTYLSGLNDVMQMVSEPEQYGNLTLQRFGASVLTPMSSLSRTIAQMGDTTIRQPSNVGEAIQANVPGLSQNVPARLNVFGEEQKRQSPAWSPISASQETSDPLERELARLDVSIGFTGKSIRGVALNPEEHRRYQAAAGQKMKERLNSLMQMDDYRSMSDADKAEALDYVARRARQEAGLEFLASMDEQELIRRMEQAKQPELAGAGVR